MPPKRTTPVPKHIAELAARARALPKPLLVALDVDGTLAPIVDDPDAARIPPETARLVRALARKRGVRVALVTGRDARSLGRLARLGGVHRAVEHGRRLLAPGERYRKPRHTEDESRRLAHFRSWAEDTAVPKGARVEEKDGAVAVHVRELAARDSGRAARVLDRARRAARDAGLHPRDGRFVVEGELVRGDKGDALAAIHDALGAGGVVYAGDDLTDGPAIRKAVSLGGLGLFVRSPERRRLPRGATAALEGPEEVRLLLGAIL